MSNSDFSVPDVSEDELLIVDKMYAYRELYWPHYTWLAQTGYLKVVETKKTNIVKAKVDIEVLKKQFSSIFNKINGSFYHLQKIKENEKLITELGIEVAQKGQPKIGEGILGMFGASYEPIGYEYEAMLVTLKSALDILAIAFSSIVGSKSDNILGLENEVRQDNNPSGLIVKIKQLLNSQDCQKLLNEFRNTNGVKSRRNYAVHIGSLSTGTINIQFVSGTPKIKLIKSKAMPVGAIGNHITEEQDLDAYCSTLFYETCDFLLKGLEIILDEKLPRGKRKSVFELKRASSRD